MISSTAMNGSSSTSKHGSANGTSNSCRDGNDYLKILNKERDYLLANADKLEKEIEELLKADVSEEVVGYLRSAAGKARLLSTKKMVQFEGLCQKNIKPPPDDPCPTKLQDLQGFWDMVMLQVDDIHQSFAAIDKMRASSWKQVPSIESSPAVHTKASSTTAKRGPVVRPTPSGPSPAALLAAQKRENQRKQLAELKKQFKLQQISSSQSSDNNDGVPIKH